MLSSLENVENEDTDADTDTGADVSNKDNDRAEDSDKASDDIDNGSHQYTSNFSDIGPCPLQQRVEILTKSCDAENESVNVTGTGAFQWILRIAGVTFVILRRAFGKKGHKIE